MKNWSVEILRRESGLDPNFHVSKRILVRGKTSISVYNTQYKKWASPYCTIGKIIEQPDDVLTEYDAVRMIRESITDGSLPRAVEIYDYLTSGRQIFITPDQIRNYIGREAEV